MNHFRLTEEQEHAMKKLLRELNEGIEAYKEEHGLKHYDLVRKSCASTTSVYRAACRSNVSIATLIRLCDAIDYEIILKKRE